MEKRFTDSEYLFKNVLVSKVNFYNSYLDIPDNNCFITCINETIKSLEESLDKNNSDYSLSLVKNFYNFLLKENILKNNYKSVYVTLISKLKEFMDGSKVSKTELYGFLYDIRRRNYSNYYKSLCDEVLKLINMESLKDVEYAIKTYEIFINEVIGVGRDIRFISLSLAELHVNEKFNNVSNFVKYIAQIKPLSQDVLDILIPINIGADDTEFLDLLDRRKQKYEIVGDVVYCKIYHCSTNDYVTLIEDQMVKIRSIFDLLKLYTKKQPDFRESEDIQIKSKILGKTFNLPFNKIRKFVGVNPYSKHLYNTIESLEKSKESDIIFYYKISNSLSYAERDMDYKNNNAYVDNWIALETLCSISNVKKGYDAIQHFLPKILITTLIRKHITQYLISAYKKYFKDIMLEDFLEEICKEDYLNFLNKIPNVYYRTVLIRFANILRNPKNLYEYIIKLEEKIHIDILRMYTLRNKYVHECNLNAAQTLEFYKLKYLYNVTIDEFFRALTNRRDKDESYLGIGFDIFNQFSYKWEIMVKTLKLLHTKETYQYKSDITKITTDSIDLNIVIDGEITYSDFLLNLLKNNNEILKKYLPSEEYDSYDEI